MLWHRIHFSLVVAIGSLCLLEIAAAADDRLSAKEDLRYDGKSFDYWQKYLRTELKALRRLDGIRAMAAFGSKGYAAPAAAAIVEEMKDIGADAYRYSEKPSDLNKVAAEAAAAVIAIGVPAFDVLVKNANAENIRNFLVITLYKLEDGKVLPLSDGANQALIQAALGDEPELRNFAVQIVGLGMWRDKKFKEKSSPRLSRRNRSTALSTPCFFNPWRSPWNFKAS